MTTVNNKKRSSLEENTTENKVECANKSPKHLKNNENKPVQQSALSPVLSLADPNNQFDCMFKEKALTNSNECVVYLNSVASKIASKGLCVYADFEYDDIVMLYLLALLEMKITGDNPRFDQWTIGFVVHKEKNPPSVLAEKMQTFEDYGLPINRVHLIHVGDEGEAKEIDAFKSDLQANSKVLRPVTIITAPLDSLSGDALLSWFDEAPSFVHDVLMYSGAYNIEKTPKEVFDRLAGKRNVQLLDVANFPMIQEFEKLQRNFHLFDVALEGNVDAVKVAAKERLLGKFNSLNVAPKSVFAKNESECSHEKSDGKRSKYWGEMSISEAVNILSMLGQQDVSGIDKDIDTLQKEIMARLEERYNNNLKQVCPTNATTSYLEMLSAPCLAAFVKDKKRGILQNVHTDFPLADIWLALLLWYACFPDENCNKFEMKAVVGKWVVVNNSGMCYTSVVPLDDVSPDDPLKMSHVLQDSKTAQGQATAIRITLKPLQGVESNKQLTAFVQNKLLSALEHTPWMVGADDVVMADDDVDFESKVSDVDGPRYLMDVVLAVMGVIPDEIPEKEAFGNEVQREYSYVDPCSVMKHDWARVQNMLGKHFGKYETESWFGQTVKIWNNEQ